MREQYANLFVRILFLKDVSYALRVHSDTQQLQDPLKTGRAMCNEHVECDLDTRVDTPSRSAYRGPYGR